MTTELFPGLYSTNNDDAAWRTQSLRILSDFTERLDARLPIGAERLGALLGSGVIRDPALRGTMLAQNLTFDRVLIVVGAFIVGDAYMLPRSSHLQREMTTLTELGLVQIVGPDRATARWSGLTQRGQQLGAYLIYRIMVAAIGEKNP